MLRTAFAACVLLACLITNPPYVAAQSAEEAFDSGDFATAQKLWRKDAYKDPYAAYNLATMYENGTGIEADYKEAFKWYKEAVRNARGNSFTMLKRQIVFAMVRIVVKNRDHDFLATASMYISTLAMKTGDPEALRMRGLLLEFQGDYSKEKGVQRADNPMKFAWGLLWLAHERGSPYAKAEASRVWKKVDDKPGAKRLIETLRSELRRNGVK